MSSTIFTVSTMVVSYIIAIAIPYIVIRKWHLGGYRSIATMVGYTTLGALLLLIIATVQCTLLPGSTPKDMNLDLHIAEHIAVPILVAGALYTIIQAMLFITGPSDV